MERFDRLTVALGGRTVGFLSLTPDGRLCAFEYDKEWLVDGFSISPLELPLKPGLFVAKPRPFNGNFGVFDDSLPDGYGRYMLHRVLKRGGVDYNSLTSIDLLSIVGDGGMGALSYIPVNDLGHHVSVDDFDRLQAIALEVLRERQDDDAALLLFNSGNSGGARPKAVFADDDGHWLIKFRHHYDPADIGIQEFRYNEAARHSGIEVPEFKLVNDRYFAVKRFDISDEGERVHVATAGGLLGVGLGEPILDYKNLLALTGYLTQDHKAVEEMFRRMVFNYVAGNKDDHSKNFSFRVTGHAGQGWKWGLAPAYDLTRCEGSYNGEHATSVNGTGHPAMSDFIAVGTASRIREERCREIIDEVTAACRDIAVYDIR